MTRIVTDGAEGESYNSARGTNTPGRHQRVDDARSGSRTREGNDRGRRTSDNDDDGDGDDDDDRDRGRGRARPRRCAHRSSSSEDEYDGRDARRHRIRPRTFDGNTPFETFWAQFQNCVTYNRWKSDDQLAFLKASLVDDAAQLLWDTGASEVDTVE